MSVNPEYLRRNLLVCKAIGAHENAKAARTRVLAWKRPPVWLVDALDGIIDRTEGLAPELACYRSSVPERLAVTAGQPESASSAEASSATVPR